MFKTGKKMNAGSSAIEVMSVVVFILGVLIAFGPYIQRGVAGHGKALGDAFGQGRQYDPREFGATGEGGGTLDCFFDDTVGDVTYHHWVDESCYQASNCDCTWRRFDGSKIQPEYGNLCESCKNNCVNDTRCQ